MESRVIVLGRVQLLLGRVDGRVQGVRVQVKEYRYHIPCTTGNIEYLIIC